MEPPFSVNRHLHESQPPDSSDPYNTSLGTILQNALTPPPTPIPSVPLQPPSSQTIQPTNKQGFTQDAGTVLWIVIGIIIAALVVFAFTSTDSPYVQTTSTTQGVYFPPTPTPIPGVPVGVVATAPPPTPLPDPLSDADVMSMLPAAESLSTPYALDQVSAIERQNVKPDLFDVCATYTWVDSFAIGMHPTIQTDTAPFHFTYDQQQGWAVQQRDPFAFCLMGSTGVHPEPLSQPPLPSQSEMLALVEPYYTQNVTELNGGNYTMSQEHILYEHALSYNLLVCMNYTYSDSTLTPVGTGKIAFSLVYTPQDTQNQWQVADYSMNCAVLQ